MNKNWIIDLEKCPHCERSINVRSTSSKSLKSCIESLIITSNLHIKYCRKKSPHKLTNIIIKEIKEISKYSSSSTWTTDKILL